MRNISIILNNGTEEKHLVDDVLLNKEDRVLLLRKGSRLEGYTLGAVFSVEEIIETTKSLYRAGEEI